MTKENFRNLERGDIVRHKMRNDSFVVMANYGKDVIAIDTVHITNPSEWILVLKTKHERVDDDA